MGVVKSEFEVVFLSVILVKVVYPGFLTAGRLFRSIHFNPFFFSPSDI